MINHRKKVEEVYEVVNEALDGWDFRFIINMEHWIGPYSNKQKKQIDRIYDDVCNSPY